MREEEPKRTSFYLCFIYIYLCTSYLNEPIEVTPGRVSREVCHVMGCGMVSRGVMGVEVFNEMFIL